jgi:dolichol-phosphate mannosyltransferase
MNPAHPVGSPVPSSVTVIIPCYNEAEGVTRLHALLLPVLQKLRTVRPVELVLVDDGSRDGTAQRLTAAFAGVPEVAVIRHPQNRNLGAALRTGLQAAKGDWIACLDADCTYDPEILPRLLAGLEAGADLVTASPYHPLGRVDGVPAWRLGLSWGLSWIYRQVLGVPVYTYTALARAWRRSLTPKIQSERDDFTAVADMMLRALVQGYRVVEVPAVLGVRVHGVSKMRVLRVIRAQLRLLLRLIFRRGTYRA